MQAFYDWLGRDLREDPPGQPDRDVMEDLTTALQDEGFIVTGSGRTRYIAR